MRLLGGQANGVVVRLTEVLRSTVNARAIPHEGGGCEGVVTLSGGLATGWARPGTAPKEVVAAAAARL